MKPSETSAACSTPNDRIKQRREDLDMTQMELAKLLGYAGRSSINKIELGIVDIPMSRIDQIAAALRTTSEWIMRGDAERSDDEEMRRHLDAFVFAEHTTTDSSSPFRLYIDNETILVIASPSSALESSNNNELIDTVLMKNDFSTLKWVVLVYGQEWSAHKITHKEGVASYKLFHKFLLDNM